MELKNHYKKCAKRCVYTLSLSALALATFGMSLVSHTSSAVAADLNGLYFGALATHVSGSNDLQQSATQLTNVDFDGLNWGALAGFNIHSHDNGILVGVEADISLGESTGSTVQTGGLLDSLNLTSIDSKIGTLATVRARIGKTFGPFMVYGTGGFAFSQVDTTIKNVVSNYKADEFHTGWTVGAGVEVALIDSISLKAEVMHVDLSSESHVFPINSAQSSVNVNPSTNLLRLGAILRF